MNFTKHMVLVSILCVLGGCAATASEPSATESASAALVRGNVSATFSVKDADQCKPIGVPLTAFVTAAFDAQPLVEDQATPMSDTECLHEQVVQASADSWATFAHDVLCGGGGDIRSCGVVATRQCTVEQLMAWASARSDSVLSRDRVFGFDYAVPPQHEPARTELYRRAQQEVETLLDETAQVMRQDTEGMRNCPNETRTNLAATYAKGQEMSRQLGDILGGAAGSR